MPQRCLKSIQARTTSLPLIEPPTLFNSIFFLSSWFFSHSLRSYSKILQFSLNPALPLHLSFSTHPHVPLGRENGPLTGDFSASQLQIPVDAPFFLTFPLMSSLMSQVLFSSSHSIYSLIYFLSAALSFLCNSFPV